MTFTIDAGWAAGMLFAMARMAGFVIASPIFSKSLPAIARFVFVIAVSIWLTVPIEGDIGLGDLFGGAITNVAVGMVLALASGLIFYLFEVAGGLVDMMSGLEMAQIFDPTSGHSSGVFARFFNMTALAIFYVTGGDRILLAGLHRSIDAVPLSGDLNFDGRVAEVLLDSVGTLMMAGIEVAAPAVLALFLAELVMGLAAKFAPQTNVFLLGMPVKIGIALGMTTAIVALFPGTMDATISRMTHLFSDAIRLLG